MQIRLLTRLCSDSLKPRNSEGKHTGFDTAGHIQSPDNLQRRAFQHCTLASFSMHFGGDIVCLRRDFAMDNAVGRMETSQRECMNIYSSRSFSEPIATPWASCLDADNRSAVEY